MLLRVLLISADAARSSALRRDLGRLGAQVTQVPPQEFAQRMGEVAPPDIVLLDLRNSAVDARGVCDMVRGERRWRGAALAALVEEGQLPHFRGRDEVDDFIVAPWREGELRARLARLGARVSGAASPTAILMGELMLDPANYEVAVRGVRVELTLKEYELLKHLITHPGRVFTRAQLLSSVWGYDYVGGTRTVDVHIRRLRAKLGEVAETAIETVRGVGYVWRPPLETG